MLPLALESALPAAVGAVALHLDTRRAHLPSCHHPSSVSLLSAPSCCGARGVKRCGNAVIELLSPTVIHPNQSAHSSTSG